MTAILLSIVKYNEYNVIKKRENMLWKIKCPFENVGAKKQRKSIRINNRSKVVCDDVNNFGSSVADKSMDEHRQTEKQQITINFRWYYNVMSCHVTCFKINYYHIILKHGFRLFICKVQIVWVNLGSCSCALSSSKAIFQEFKANHMKVSVFFKAMHKLPQIQLDL